MRTKHQLKERDIKHEVGTYWVADTGDSYTVFKNEIWSSVSDSSYAHTSDGLSMAVARCNYLAKRFA